MDLSGIQLTLGIASVLSDVLTIEWGLRKLVFKECDLDEHVSDRSIGSELLATDTAHLDTEADTSLVAHTRQSHFPLGCVQSATEGACVPINRRVLVQGMSKASSDSVQSIIQADEKSAIPRCFAELARQAVD